MKAAVIIICYLALISCTVIRAQDDGGRPHFNETMHRDCMERNGIKWEMIKQRSHRNVEEYKKALSCLKACRAQGMGLMSGSSINYEELNGLLDKLTERCDLTMDTRESVHNCTSNIDKSADECTVGAEFAECLSSNLHSCFYQSGRGTTMNPQNSTEPSP